MPQAIAAHQVATFVTLHPFDPRPLGHQVAADEKPRATTGPDFDRMFLQMMTIHHQGAISMAKTEQADGSNPQAIELATSIQTSQTSEV